jgi:hypothetical protein
MVSPGRWEVYFRTQIPTSSLFYPIFFRMQRILILSTIIQPGKDAIISPFDLPRFKI